MKFLLLVATPDGSDLYSSAFNCGVGGSLRSVTAIIAQLQSRFFQSIAAHDNPLSCQDVRGVLTARGDRRGTSEDGEGIGEGLQKMEEA